MTSFETERRALQASVIVAAIVPVAAGLWGVIGGLGPAGSFLDSHMRYLSGLLFGAGVMFWILSAGIDRWRWPFRTLCALIVFGGLARLGAALADGMTPSTAFALIMELIVTPGLFFWRERIDRLAPATTAVPVTAAPFHEPETVIVPPVVDEADAAR